MGADFPIDPHADHGLEHLLKSLEPFMRTVGFLKCPMQIADLIAAFEQLGQTALQYFIALIFVEFRDHNWFGELQAGLQASITGKSGSVFVTNARPGPSSIESSIAFRPILTQQASLFFSYFGKFVVVL